MSKTTIYSVVLDVTHTYEIEAETEQDAVAAAKERLKAGKQGDSIFINDDFVEEVKDA